jgi:Outer membrane protein beta-barrel domain
MPLRTLSFLISHWLLICCVSISAFFTTNAQAEWYVGGYGGIASPGAFSNTTLSEAPLGGGVDRARIVDLELDASGVFGAKVGYFTETYKWLGFETEAYTLTPNVKQQTIVGGTASGRVFATNLPETSLRLTPWVFNIIIRSPAISERFYPYAGMGYGLFFTTSSKGGESNLHIDNGLNVFLGARYVVRPKLVLFGEYKYNSAKIHFNDVQGNYNSQMFIFGVMWHFGE